MEAKVSVIIPAYNAERFIRRSVESVRAQSFTDWEIVIVDDGSTDATAQIADSLAASDPRINVVHKTPNAGLAEARRTGHVHAHGQYHFHLDADDTLPPDALEFLTLKADENDLDFVISGACRIHGNKSKLINQRPWEGVVSDKEKMLSLIFDYRFGFLRGTCFSRGELWKKYDFFPVKDRILPCEDFLMSTAVINRCDRIGVYNHPTYNYFCTEGSLSSVKPYSSQEGLKTLMRSLEDILASTPHYHAVKPMFNDFVLSLVTFEINKTTPDPWIDEITHYDVSKSSLKIKVCRFLMRHERLRKPVVLLHDYVRRLQGE